MSDDPLAMFSAALSADKAMQADLQTAIGEKKDAEALSAITAFAAEQGFALTGENLTQLQRRNDTAMAEGELSDGDLDGMAGGRQRPARRPPHAVGDNSLLTWPTTS